jgi:hypothetical protein
MVLGVVGVGAARASIMVDDFTQSIGPVWPQVQNASTSGGSPETEAGLSGVLGGVRGYVVKSATIGVAGLDQLSSNVFHNGTVSLFDYQSSAGASGTVELFYGDAAANPLAVANVTDMSIVMPAFDNANGGPLQILVGWTERTGPSTSITMNTLTNVTTAGSHTLGISNPLPVGATVDKLTIDFISPAGTDFRVDSISLTTVPEPASLGVMGVGALMLLRRRR